MKKIFQFALLLSVFGCNSTTIKYKYGEFCAEVSYYNDKTGRNSNYNLPIEVEYGKLVKIKWSNGGWLDDSHFTPPDISNGSANFKDDRGRKYEITINEDIECNL